MFNQRVDESYSKHLRVRDLPGATPVSTFSPLQAAVRIRCLSLCHSL